MIKEIIALAATALFSLNASAGYVQYNLSGPVSGYFVQHDDDKSIAYYVLNVQGQNIHARFAPSGIFDTGGASTTNFAGPGPSNLGAYDNLTDYYVERVLLDFSRAPANTFAYTATYSQYPIPDLPRTAPSYPGVTIFQGTAALGVVDPFLIASLDSQGGYVDGIVKAVPTVNKVPEPASLALFAVGALGAASAARRRKSRR